LKDWIHKDENTIFKGLMYFGFAALTSIPIFHLLIKEIFIQSSDRYSTLNSFIYYILTMVSYVFGLYIYIAKYPEKLKPGKYDIWVKL